MADIVVEVIDHAGNAKTISATDGWRLMEVIKDAGLPIRAECGGCCACATCHVYVEGGGERLDAPDDDEVDMLEEALEVSPASRLSCQVVMTPALSGLKVRLAPGTED